MLRIEAVMKRSARAEVKEEKRENKVVSLDGGRLRADITARIVYIDGERVDMSPKEYDLFFYMLENPNVAISRERFISDVWGYDFYGDVRTLDTHIKLLRKSLGRYSDMIVTLRGVGYRFEGK
jgi:DNA-binding response OmpR family regulator